MTASVTGNKSIYSFSEYMTFENRIDLDILHMYNQNYDEGLDVFMFVNQMTYGERDDDGEEGAKIPAG